MATSLHGWQLKPISLSPLACLLAWRVPTGSQRVPKGLQKGTPKWPKIDQKSIRAALGMPKGVRGYPPGASEAPNMHFYAYFAHIYAYLCIFCAYLCMFSLVLCMFIHIVAHVIHFCTRLCISMHFQACLWMCIYIWYKFVHICVLYEYVYKFTHIYSWEDADLLSTKSHAAGLHSTGSWNICKYTQYKFVSKLYRKHRHTFERWTGMTPWHGGGLGAVRL